jgi:hypothetical protein
MSAQTIGLAWTILVWIASAGVVVHMLITFVMVNSHGIRSWRESWFLSLPLGGAGIWYLIRLWAMQ